jgi:DNA-binding NarL/FixJ family response regulator
VRSIVIGELSALLSLGLRELLESSEQFNVRETTMRDLLKDVQAVSPEVVVLDLDRADSDAMAERIVRSYPSIRVLACSSVKAVMRIYPSLDRGQPYMTALDPTSLTAALAT